MGRLIGPKGASIQELERRTGCRCRVHNDSIGGGSSGSSGAADKVDHKQPAKNRLQESPPLQQKSTVVAGAAADARVSIRCCSGGSRDAQEAAEALCRRAAELFATHGLSLDEALTQAVAEKEEMERLEAERQSMEELEDAARRLVIEWPEFRPEDAKLALQEALLDEDAAFLLLQQGLRAPVLSSKLDEDHSSPAGCEDDDDCHETTDCAAAGVPRKKNPILRSSTPRVQEDFPALIGNLQSPTRGTGEEAPLNVSLVGFSAAWGEKARTHQAPRNDELKSTRQFPGLPEGSKPVGRRPVRTKSNSRTEYLRQLRPQVLCRRA